MKITYEDESLLWVCRDFLWYYIFQFIIFLEKGASM